ncbi:MAG: hypothetical protein ACRDIA_00895, partial [Actinomycetota bacterium]
RFDAEMHDALAARAPEVLEHIRTKGDFPEELENRLKEVLADFKANFTPTDTAAAAAAKEQAKKVAETGEDAAAGDEDESAA